MQGAGDARALERLLGGILGPRRHQARHFSFRDGDLFSSVFRKPDIGDGVLGGFGHGVQNSQLVWASNISEADGMQ